MLSRRKSMWMRLPASPSVPSTPSAPPSASGTIGRRFGSTSRSPNSSVSTGTNGTCTEPVAPRSITVSDGSSAMPSSCDDPRRERGMARAGVEHEAERALAVDVHRRPDAADPVAARRRDVARLVGRDGDVVEHDGAIRAPTWRIERRDRVAPRLRPGRLRATVRRPPLLHPTAGPDVRVSILARYCWTASPGPPGAGNR